jgi:hypothetical protein
MLARQGKARQDRLGKHWLQTSRASYFVVSFVALQGAKFFFLSSHISPLRPAYPWVVAAVRPSRRMPPTQHPTPTPTPSRIGPFAVPTRVPTQMPGWLISMVLGYSSNVHTVRPA